MALTKLDVLAVRNIQTASLFLSPHINLITGANASGKSSLLEAIFILGRAKSFRTNHVKQAINFAHSQLIVSAQHQMQNGLLTTLGIRIDGKQCEIRIDQINRHKADLAYALPVQLVHPKSYRLLDGPPQLRREFLDWGVFNQNQLFLQHWRKFAKALQQRNAALKTHQHRLLPAWDNELAEYGSIINHFRQQYIAQLQPVFLKLAGMFLEVESVELKYACGWDTTDSLLDILQRAYERDLRFGFTHYGPHRAELSIYVDNRPAKDYMSRGQQKLLVLALLLAQVDLFNKISPFHCCILIDDLCAELDAVNRLKLLKYLVTLQCQVFLTATELTDFGDLDVLPSFKVFHVEHGSIKQQ